MLIIIPLGGLGERFKKSGYQYPKPLVNVLGKNIIQWLIDNLKLNTGDRILIPYNQDLSKYHFEEELKKSYPKTSFFFMEMRENTQGASDTIYQILQKFEETNQIDEPILSLDGDNFYTCDILQLWKSKNKIFVFEDLSKEPIYSYIQTDSHNQHVEKIIEKEKISNLACTGAYGFDSWKNLKKYCKLIMDLNIRQKNEFYISTVIQKMIEDNIQFDYQIISSENYICLGTPLHVRIFCNNFPRINALNGMNMIKPKRFCFDLDNTLVTYPEKDGDYSTVKPIEKNIKMVQYLKKMGNTIIIHTARRMKTHHGNVGGVLKDIGPITFETLEKFKIPYDELYFGKPYADYYIDDKAVLAYNDLEKELGFYNTMINPRDFHQISLSTAMQIIKKEGSDLSGEINYYQHIPNDVKDLFPIYIRGDEDYHWYEMEKINGIPISKLFLSEELTVNQIDYILGSLHRLHQIKINTNPIDIYFNYIEKMTHRYQTHSYSQYSQNVDLYYKKIINKMYEYKEKGMGVEGMIHGDPVMTNIMINQYGKIKLIDMRGKIGDKLTIYGDIMYDYSKFYQSLIGYDEILEGRKVNTTYKMTLIHKFDDFIIKHYGKEYLEYIQMITASLLFTLIPLHDNEKCISYFHLMETLIDSLSFIFKK